MRVKIVISWRSGGGMQGSWCSCRPGYPITGNRRKDRDREKNIISSIIFAAQSTLRVLSDEKYLVCWRSSRNAIEMAFIATKQGSPDDKWCGLPEGLRVRKVIKGRERVGAKVGPIFHSFYETAAWYHFFTPRYIMSFFLWKSMSMVSDLVVSDHLRL